MAVELDDSKDELDEERGEVDEEVDEADEEVTINRRFFSLPHLSTALLKSNCLRVGPLREICSKASMLLVAKRFLSVVFVRFIALKPLSHSALLTGRDRA